MMGILITDLRGRQANTWSVRQGFSHVFDQLTNALAADLSRAKRTCGIAQHRLTDTDNLDPHLRT
jgi:hypothetical protein